MFRTLTGEMKSTTWMEQNPYNIISFQTDTYTDAAPYFGSVYTCAARYPKVSFILFLPLLITVLRIRHTATGLDLRFRWGKAHHCIHRLPFMSMLIAKNKTGGSGKPTASH